MYAMERQRIIVRLHARAREAEAKAHDRYWQNGPHNVQAWVAQAYLDAIFVVRDEGPRSGESLRAYIERVRGIVHGLREQGREADDEAWYASANDGAVGLIQ